MEVAGITNLKRFVDDFFGKSDKSSYTSQFPDKTDRQGLFSGLKPECALVVLSRFGYLCYRRRVSSFTWDYCQKSHSEEKNWAPYL